MTCTTDMGSLSLSNDVLGFIVQTHFQFADKKKKKIHFQFDRQLRVTLKDSLSTVKFFQPHNLFLCNNLPLPYPLKDNFKQLRYNLYYRYGSRGRQASQHASREYLYMFINLVIFVFTIVRIYGTYVIYICFPLHKV